MTSAAERLKQLSAFLDKLRSKHRAAQSSNSASEDAAADCRCHNDPVLRELVRSFLQWETTAGKADSAMNRIENAVVDINELRVCTATEIGEILGPGLPRLDERATRLRATLHEIFKREHALRLAHLLDKSKKESRQYLESLTDAPRFVIARTSLVALLHHAVPLDERLLSCLKHAKAVDPEIDLEAAASLIDRAVKSGDAAATYAALQAWADDLGTVVVKTNKPPVARKSMTDAATKPASKARRTAVKPAKPALTRKPAPKKRKTDR